MMKKEPNNTKAVKMKGHFRTSQRRLLMELIKEAEGHLDAKELFHRARVKDESICPATVYRNLNLFKELGLIEERRLNKARCYYEIKKSPDHQHLLCQGCGKVVEFENPYFDKLVELVKQEHGFKINRAELYLEGYCPDCEGKKSKD